MTGDYDLKPYWLPTYWYTNPIVLPQVQPTWTVPVKRTIIEKYEDGKLVERRIEET